MRWIFGLRARRLLSASPCAKVLSDLPKGLEEYWRATAPREYKGIRTDALFFVRAADGLLRFFDVAARAGVPCALPSDAADSVWRAWLRWDAASLTAFCERHFGKALAHVDQGELPPGALMNTFAGCYLRDAIAPTSLRVPALFGLDAAVRMPRGHGYWKGDGYISYARLNARGRGEWRDRPHPDLTLGSLVAAGVLDRRFLDAARKQADDDSGPFGLGNDMALLAADGGNHHDGGGHGDCDGGTDAGGGCDGGSDGGSGCGSSCGGGGGD